MLYATKILNEKSDSDAKYDYTVKCTIKGVQNVGLNLYYVEYGANTFTACANNGASYEVNDIVYALIPESDFGQELQIIGVVSSKASMYIPDNESDFYTAISDNLLLNINEINLKSWVDTSYNVSFNTNILIMF